MAGRHKRRGARYCLRCGGHRDRVGPLSLRALCVTCGQVELLEYDLGAQLTGCIEWRRCPDESEAAVLSQIHEQVEAIMAGRRAGAAI